MEDYTGAFLERKQDTNALLNLHDRCIATFHFGGIAIECRLKALLVFYHRIDQWEKRSLRRKDVMFRQPIKNPNHGLLTALKRMPKLYERARLDKNFIIHLQNIIHPLGATNIDYISLRYIAQSSQSQNNWKQSFDYVCGWLKKNERIAQ
jgi:hypothetical protein